MPLRIELRDRGGSVLDVTAESWKSISTQWPETSFEEYPLLAGIDPDGRTMFNRLQMEFGINELKRLYQTTSSGRVGLIARVLEMSQRGVTMNDAELWFLGD